MADFQSMKDNYKGFSTRDLQMVQLVETVHINEHLERLNGQVGTHTTDIGDLKLFQASLEGVLKEREKYGWPKSKKVWAGCTGLVVFGSFIGQVIAAVIGIWPF